MRNYSIQINDYLERFIKNILLYNKKGILLNGMTLSLVDLLLISYLGDNGNKKMFEVIEDLDIDRNSLVTLINRLQKKQLLGKVRSLRDRRTYILDLTPKGRNIYLQLLESEEKILSDLLGDFTFNEEKTILKFLVKLDMLNKAMTRDCDKLRYENGS